MNGLSQANTIFVSFSVIDTKKKAMVRNTEMGAKLRNFSAISFVTSRLSGYQFCLLLWRSGLRVPAPGPTTLEYYWFGLFTASKLLNNASDEARPLLLLPPVLCSVILITVTFNGMYFDHMTASFNTK
jgi:hypothetical protein